MPDDRAAPHTVIVQSGEGGPPHRIAPGQRLTFGRGAPGRTPDIVLANPAVSRLGGEVVAREDYWRVSNFSADTGYVVENLEGAGEYVRVPPRRLGVPVPFELSRLVLPGVDGRAELKVFAPGHAFADLPPPGVAGEPTVSAFALDETARYFQVLTALCEPRLRDPSATRIPGSEQIAARLGLGASAVAFHIGYLADHKLRLRDRGDSGREALVALALRFGLVREEHLALLPPGNP
ncbi:hypothetical protein AB0M43_10125 [Longispora sp. NPDC051575]|uniref:hypothetical protein n=1 Tax=Longispora sp. NPDC051575 TaxID=3154943 RepID=UPI0034456F1E